MEREVEEGSMWRNEGDCSLYSFFFFFFFIHRRLGSPTRYSLYRGTGTRTRLVLSAMGYIDPNAV
jgi:hypothetical protein